VIVKLTNIDEINIGLYIVVKFVRCVGVKFLLIFGLPFLTHFLWPRSRVACAILTHKEISRGLGFEPF